MGSLLPIVFLPAFLQHNQQDHRFIKRLGKPGMGFFSYPTAWRTLQGYEVINMVRKGQAQNVNKGDISA
jgi:transposase, IS6 family